MNHRLASLLAALMAVLGMLAVAACTTQQDQDPIAVHQASQDASTTETPKEDSVTEDFFSSTYELSEECFLEGSVTEGEVETVIDGRVVVGYGNVETRRPEGVWANTIYTLTISWSGERNLDITIAHTRVETAADVAGGFEWLDYPDVDGKLWTEYQYARVETDGTGGTLEAEFSYRNDLDAPHVSVDVSFVCDDEDPQLG